MSVAKRVLDSSDAWPALPLSAWADTYATLHMWTQIVGKVRLALSPHVNHWWEVPLYVSARGLTTSPDSLWQRRFRNPIRFHRSSPRSIHIRWTKSKACAWSRRRSPISIRDFSRLLEALEIEVKIWNMPVEIPNPIRFSRTECTAPTIRVCHTFWRPWSRWMRMLKEFRSRFLARSARCIFSGEVLTWPSRVFPGVGPRNARKPTSSQRKRIPTK